MRRAILLSKLREAGFKKDSATFVRLYTENRISYKVALEEWRKGLSKAAGKDLLIVEAFGHVVACDRKDLREGLKI